MKTPLNLSGIKDVNTVWGLFSALLTLVIRGYHDVPVVIYHPAHFDERATTTVENIKETKEFKDDGEGAILLMW